MSAIVIIDYGMANLRSVQKAFEKVGHMAVISDRPEMVSQAEKIVLPGVGAFRDAIARLTESGLAEPIVEHIRQGKKFLGICLGLQLLFDVSYEEGEHRGLGVFAGEVVRFQPQPGIKVPHMGWNQLKAKQSSPLLSNQDPESSYYFVHSYYVAPKDSSIIATETDYPHPFTSAIWHENVFATQFHPEKSQKAGQVILRNFVEW